MSPSPPTSSHPHTLTLSIGFLPHSLFPSPSLTLSSPTSSFHSHRRTISPSWFYRPLHCYLFPPLPLPPSFSPFLPPSRPHLHSVRSFSSSLLPSLRLTLSHPFSHSLLPLPFSLPPFLYLPSSLLPSLPTFELSQCIHFILHHFLPFSLLSPPPSFPL